MAGSARENDAEGWPAAGMWWTRAETEPLRTAARRLVLGAGASDPLGLTGPRALVPDARSARALHDHLRALGGRSAGAVGRVYTVARLIQRLLPPEAPPALSWPILSELARAVDHYIRRQEADFPILSGFAPGAGLPEALAKLFRDLRRAALDTRSPGAVAALERLDPPGIGQELLKALGMIEGRLEAHGWRDEAARIAQAKTHLGLRGLSEPERRAPWLVVGFEHAPMGAIDLLRELARETCVLWLAPPVSAAAAEAEALLPLSRSLAWAGAARWAGGAAEAPGGGEVRIERLHDPGSVAARALDVAVDGATPPTATLLVAADPGRWWSLVDEACRAAGLGLVAELDRALPSPPLRWFGWLVDGWAHGLSASRAADLLGLAASLALVGWGDDPGLGDRADAELRRRGLRRGAGAIAEALGEAPLTADAGAALAGALAGLDGAQGAVEALEAAAELLMGLGLWRLTRGRSPLEVRRATEQAGAVVETLRELAATLPEIWPSEPAHSPTLLALRVREAIGRALPSGVVRVTPGRRGALRLQSLDSPLPAGVERIVLLGAAESDLRSGGESTHLIPDRVRATAAVASQAHWPWHSDGSARRRERLEALVAGTLAPRATVLVAARDRLGREVVPWSGLPLEGVASPPPVARERRLLPPEVATGPGARGGDRAARRSGLDGRGLSATAADTYRACPRRFYFDRVLGATDREPVRYDLDARARGTWLHDLLRMLFQRHPDWWRPRPSPEEVHALLVAEDEGAARLITGAGRDFRRLQADSIVRGLADALASHAEILAATPGVAPRAYEVSLREDAQLAGGLLRLRGTLDRIDLVMDPTQPGAPARGFVVVDYKTGGVGAFGLHANPSRRRVQLLLYAWLAERALKLPCLAAMAVPILRVERPRGFVLADPDLPVATGWYGAASKADRVDRAGLEAAMADALDEAFDVARAIRQGRFEASPADELTCSYCPHALYCPEVCH